MAAKESAETKHAIYLVVTEGRTVLEAARMAGIWPSTLHRALKRRKKGKA